MTDMLKTVADSGTAKVLSDIGFDVAGKTGTAGVKAEIPTLCFAVTTPEYLFILARRRKLGPSRFEITGNVSARMAKSFWRARIRRLPQILHALPTS